VRGSISFAMNFAVKRSDVCRLVSAVLLFAFVFPAEAQIPEALHHARRAQQWMTAKQYAASLPEWEAALKLDSSNAQFHNLYGLALQETGRDEQARQQFRKAVRLMPSMADAHSNLGYSLWKAGREQEAAASFDAALGLRPGDASLHLARGLLAFDSGDSPLACRHFEQARPWPQDAATLWAVFQACLAGKRTETALAAAAILPRAASTQALVSRALISFHQPAAAIRFLQEAGEAGALPETPLLLAEALLEAGDPAGALAVLDTQKPAGRAFNFTEMELRGSCLLKLGRKEEARQQFQLLVEHFPRDPEAYVHATQILLEEKNWQQALSILNSGLERLPGDWLLLLRRAVVYRLSGRLREARHDILEAAARGGEMSLVLASLGQVSGDLNDFAAAVRVFREALAETGRPEFQFALASALDQQGESQAALREMQKAAEQLPKVARVQYEYGKLLQRAGRVHPAREAFERARQLDPGYAPNLYSLSRLYASLGQPALAAQAADEFLAARQRHEPKAESK